jgi:hypothetical protein
VNRSDCCLSLEGSVTQAFVGYPARANRKRAGELVDRVEFDAQKVHETTDCQEDRSEAVGKERWPRTIQGMLVLTSDGEGWGRGCEALS